MDHFVEAQREHLAGLRQQAVDRPAHLAYIEACLAVDYDDIMEVKAPKGVSVRVADAILDDVFWIRQPKPRPGYHVSQYGHAYSNRRSIDSQAARVAQRTKAAHQGSLESLLTLKKET